MTNTNTYSHTWVNQDGTTATINIAAHEGEAVKILKRISPLAHITGEISISPRWDGCISIGDYCRIGDGVSLLGSVYIATGVRIGSGTTLRGNRGRGRVSIRQLSQIGENCTVENAVLAEKCVLGDGVSISETDLPAGSRVGKGTTLQDVKCNMLTPTVVGSKCQVLEATIRGSATLGDRVFLGRANLEGENKLGDGSVVEDFTTLEAGVEIPASAHILSSRRVTAHDAVAVFETGKVHIGAHGTDILGEIPPGVAEVMGTAFANWQKQMAEAEKKIEERLRTSEGRFKASLLSLEERVQKLDKQLGDFVAWAAPSSEEDEDNYDEN